jgi:flagellar assembly factor FliW
LETARFGTLELPESAIVRFPQPLYGLEGRHSYCLLEHDAMSGFHWLQSTEEPALALIVTDPFRHFPAYELEIPDDLSRILGAQEPADVTVYTTVSIAPDRTSVTTNLLGPLVINHQVGLGMQVIQDSRRYHCRHTLASR